MAMRGLARDRAASPATAMRGLARDGAASPVMAMRARTIRRGDGV
jgi:hypothetical protein